MSAAATAAGYLYASGRLRGRGAREQEQQQHPHPHERQHQERRAERPAARKEVRVAVLPEPGETRSAAPRKTPKFAYRKRRWTPE
jgi:hypothetical protein